MGGFSRPFGTGATANGPPGSELPGYYQTSLRERPGAKCPNSSPSDRGRTPVELNTRLFGFMSFNAQRLYELLPAIYRVRDAQQGEPLRELLSIFAEQVAVLEENLAQLYDDQFIETCAEWAVPFIGDLVGTRGIFTFPEATFSQRAQVANTLAYRRRKGTATVLEQLARDVTGWNANVVEYFQRLATTQYLNHLRPRNLSFTSLRNQITIEYRTKVEFGRISEQTIKLPNWEILEYLPTPFDGTARTADVRRIESRRGKHNIPNVGIHLWRIESFPVLAATAFRVDARRYRFDPLGRDLPLFNHVQTETEISHLAEPINVPMPLSRRVLNENFDVYYGQNASLLVEPDPASPPSPAAGDTVSICNLSDITDASGHVTGWAHMPTDHIAIDPMLGRIALPEDAANVRVDYHYGFVGRMGGGTYGRGTTFSTGLTPVVRVPHDHATIQAALTALAGTGGVVEIENNDTYFETPSISVAAGTTIELRAADEFRPVLFLDGEMVISGGAESKLILNGLWIAGGNIRVPLVAGNDLRTLTIRHCTLSPAATPSPGTASPPDAPLPPVQLIVEIPNLSLEIEKAITGPLRVAPEAEASIADSIIDAAPHLAADTSPLLSPPVAPMAYAGLNGQDHGGPLQLRNCTVIGQVRVEVMTLASNTIFFARSEAGEAPVEARRLQEGCVRFSWVPPNSQLPRKFQCQPDQALIERAEELGLDSTTELPSSDRAYLLARIKPVFTSLRFGDPAYGQLSQLAPSEIREGADDEAEMGAFHGQYQPQKEANLRTRLDEYLRFGLEAGIFYAT